MDLSQKKQEDELLQLVTFSIGEEEFGVNILKVQEIIRTMAKTAAARAASGNLERKPVVHCTDGHNLPGRVGGVVEVGHNTA